MLVLFGVCPAARAGSITFGGDFAGMPSSPIGTPALIAGGTLLDIPFSATLLGVGSVMGTVRLQNNTAATSGGIAINDFVFQSFRPSGAGPVSFTVLVEQDYAYTGGPVGSGTFTLNSLSTFTGFPQNVTVAECALFERNCSGPGGFAFPLTATPGGPLPQAMPYAFVGDAFTLTLTAPVHLELGLALTLSDNALGVGPRIASGPGALGGSAFGWTVPYPLKPIETKTTTLPRSIRNLKREATTRST